MGLPDILDPEDDFGLPKENYSVVRDPRKDFDFAEYERLAVAVAMQSYTAPRAWVKITGSNGNVAEHKAVWGETSAVAPTCTATATGEYTITFPVTVQDLNPTADRVSTSSVQFTTVQATLHEGGQIYASAYANVITVSTQSTGGVAADKNFTVWGYR